MARKADAKHTPEQPTLDDDANWLLIETARQRMSERTNDTALTIDLEKAMADYRLPCMVQSTATGERKFVVPTAWTDPDQFMLDDTPTGVRVVHRYERKPGGYAVRPFRGGRFFVWLPHFDRIWPPPGASAPATDYDDDSNPPRLKPGPKPYKDWPTLIARWLLEISQTDPQRLQNLEALSPMRIIFCTTGSSGHRATTRTCGQRYVSCCRMFATRLWNYPRITPELPPDRYCR